MVKNRLRAYPFFGELNASRVQQLSIEAAQPRLDLSRPVAFGKLQAMVAGALLVRRELS